MYFEDNRRSGRARERDREKREIISSPVVLTAVGPLLSEPDILQQAKAW